MQKPKQTWDTRAWLVGIFGGILGGSLTAWATYPPFQKRLNAAANPLFGHHSAEAMSGFSGAVAALVLPGLVSGLSRRVTFLWGLLPLSLFLVSMEAEDWIENGIKSVTKDWWISLAGFGVCLVISSRPVSLIRWLRVRAARRHDALLASYQASREAALNPQEGVWPPPPEYKA